jgi:hypothetical protein
MQRLVMKEMRTDLIISSDATDFCGPQKYHNKPVKKAQNPRRRTMARKINAPETWVCAKRVGRALGE